LTGEVYDRFEIGGGRRKPLGKVLTCEAEFDIGVFAENNGFVSRRSADAGKKNHEEQTGNQQGIGLLEQPVVNHNLSPLNFMERNCPILLNIFK
jgi:hypothetical protein